MITIKQYVKDMQDSISGQFGERGRYGRGRAGVEVLARDVGQGLADYRDEAIKPILGTLYSRLLVRNTFGLAGGVPVDAKEFVEAIQREIRLARWRKTLGAGDRVRIMDRPDIRINEMFKGKIGVIDGQVLAGGWSALVTVPDLSGPPTIYVSLRWLEPAPGD